jgi:hypothetical protein
MVYQFPTPFQEQQRDAILNIILGINEPVWQPTLFSFLFSLKKKKIKTPFFTLPNNFLHFSLTKNSKLLSPLYRINQFLFFSQKTSNFLFLITKQLSLLFSPKKN